MVEQTAQELIDEVVAEEKDKEKVNFEKITAQIDKDIEKEVLDGQK